ncbi:MAG: hypothetical protein DRP42_06525, partial [Tenericutes bacterium]
ARETGWLKFLGEQAADLETHGQAFTKFMSEKDAAAVKKGFASSAAEGTAALHKVKYGSPFPEVYMRGRRQAAQLMAANSSAAKNLSSPTAKELLKRAGLEKLSNVKISEREFRAFDSFVGTWSQEFTGKVEGASFGLVEALSKSRQGQDLGPIKAELLEMTKRAAESEKAVMIARGFTTQEQMIGPAAKVFGEVEKAFGEKRFTATPYGALYGVSGDKSLRAAATAMGSNEVAMAEYEDLFMAQELAKTRGVKIHSSALMEETNRAIVNESRGVPSHIQQRMRPKNLVRGLKGVWASGWQGKAALILGGALGVKGLHDAVGGGDSFAPSQAPLPPDLRMPMAPPAPQFAIPMADTRVENVREQAFMTQGAVEGPYFDTSSLYDHLSTNITGSRLAFGQVSMQNRPMTETEMEHLLRDKMRSDF